MDWARASLWGGKALGLALALLCLTRSIEPRETLNARTSFQKLERTLAANFDNGDLFITLTYDDKHLPRICLCCIHCLVSMKLLGR